MTEAWPTVLSTLAQVSASLAALIGFLGLWKLDGLRREKEQAEIDLRQLMAASTGQGHLDWFGLINRPQKQVLSEAKRIANTPPDQLRKQQEKDLQEDIQKSLKLWKTTLPCKIQWLRIGLVFFLSLAMLVFFVAFWFLNTPFHLYVLLPVILLAVGTLYMVGQMALPSHGTK